MSTFWKWATLVLGGRVMAVFPDVIRHTATRFHFMRTTLVTSLFIFVLMVMWRPNSLLIFSITALNTGPCELVSFSCSYHICRCIISCSMMSSAFRSSMSYFTLSFILYIAT